MFLLFLENFTCRNSQYKLLSHFVFTRSDLLCFPAYGGDSILRKSATAQVFECFDGMEIIFVSNNCKKQTKLTECPSNSLFGECEHLKTLLLCIIHFGCSNKLTGKPSD